MSTARRSSTQTSGGGSTPPETPGAQFQPSRHGEHEKRTGAYDEDWPDWYSAYMVAEQSGAELPT
ncbi:MAG TPA: hypothetical protein VNP92_02280 [Actinophytocola sp.]|nr:hypothetical protein [Actinophytocola sp.]